MKKTLIYSIFVILTIILSTSVTAKVGDLSIALTPVDYVIHMNETAEYILTINNELPKIDYFTVYSIEPEWSIEMLPRRNNIKVHPLTVINVTLAIKPSSTLRTGSYGVPVNVKASLQDEIRKGVILIDLLPSTPLIKDYLPAVTAKVKISDKIDPSKDRFNIVVDLKNQNPLELSDVTLILKSKIVDKVYETTLGSVGSVSGEKTVEFNIPLDPLTSPQDDILKTTVIVNSGGKEYSFEEDSIPFEITAYGTIDSDSATAKRFLIEEKRITLVNTGNIPRSTKYLVKSGWLKSLFSSPDPITNRDTINGNTGYVWDVELDVGETTEITVTTSYRPLFYAFIIAIIVVILYFLLRSPVVIKKTAWISGTKHGGIYDMNIQIDVKNRSSKVMQHMIVVDKIPNLVDVLKEFKIGTIHPTKILKHEKKGTIVKWDIGVFDPHEERVISYRARAKLAVLGQLDLPIAMVKFKKEGDPKQLVQSSDMVRIVQK